jgi:hypothetical protein
MRSRRQSRRSLTSLPIWPTRGIGAVPCLAGKTTAATVLASRVNTTPVTLTTRNSSNPHKPRATHRGFVPRGLSYAKRRPKLFTGAAGQLSGGERKKPTSRCGVTEGKSPRFATRVAEWPAEAGDAPARNCKKACNMVKRHKEEEIVGVLEFRERTSEDPEVMRWLAEHKAQNGGKIRVSQGSTGVRVAFSKAADMALWRERSKPGGKGKR